MHYERGALRFDHVRVIYPICYCRIYIDINFLYFITDISLVADLQTGRLFEGLSIYYSFISGLVDRIVLSSEHRALNLNCECSGCDAVFSGKHLPTSES